MKQNLVQLFICCNLILSTTCHDYALPDFDSAMYCTSKYKKVYSTILKNRQEASFIDVTRNLYTTFIKNLPWQHEPKIPKIIHQIWVGPKELPKDFKKWQKTWLSMHPDWEYRLWTDKDVAHFPLVNQEFYDTTTSYGEKANILRYEILYHFGGLYIDTDFECIQPIDFLHHTCDFFMGFEFPQPNKTELIIGNAIIGARPAHPLLKLFIENIQNFWHHTWQPKRSGTFFVTEIIKRNLVNCTDTTIIFPANFFYPWADSKRPWEERNENYRDFYRPESIGFHHWDLTWQKK